MKLATLRVVCVGAITPGAKQFLTILHQNNLLDLTYEADFDRFCKAPAPPNGQVVFIESTPESRNQILKLRGLSRRLFIVWFGRSFTKEDLTFALEQRVFYVMENTRPDDKKVLEGLQMLAQSLENDEQFDQLVRGLKAVLLQSEADVPKQILQEIKTAVAKLERYGHLNTFIGTQTNAGSSEMKLPFHKSQDLADALLTVHDLERTGVLWIRGAEQGQEGKIEFLQGKILSVIVAEVHGLKALHRMFLWDQPRFLFTRSEPDQTGVVEPLTVSVKHMCEEGVELKKRYEAIRRELPPPHIKLELDPNSLHPGTRLERNEFLTLGSVIEFNKISEILDYNTLPDVHIYEALISLRRGKLIRVMS